MYTNAYVNIIDSQSNTANAAHPRQSFSKKNELPQAKLEPATFCVLACILYVCVSVSLQPPPEMIKTVKKTASLHRSTTKKRVSGPGSYQVVQCGTAGHNIRSKPSMRGTPVGRLNKSNIIEAIEEVYT